jgi:3-oxoacyl-[acyl-carrier protein] reductase
MINLENRNILITGCSGGIGKSLALILNAAGGNIIVHYHQNEEEAKKILERLHGHFNIMIQADLSDPMQTKAMFKEIKRQSHTLDVLVNNAGAIIDDHLSVRTPLERWRKPFDINLNSVFNCSKEGIKLLRKSEHPRIINIASVSASIAFPGQSSYAASKAAIVSFSRTLAVELAPWKILVNTVSPGLIDVGMHSHFTEEQKHAYLQNIPLQRFGEAHEVSHVVAFLASDLSSYITGKEFVIDGGLIP